MHLDNLVVIVTLLALIVYLWTGIRVGRARHRFEVKAPATNGPLGFECAYRAQMNTLEWLPLCLVPMWLFAWLWDPRIAAGLGLVWVLARVQYALGYTADPARRTPGFMVQAVVVMVLLAGDLGKAVYLAVTGG